MDQTASIQTTNSHSQSVKASPSTETTDDILPSIKIEALSLSDLLCSFHRDARLYRFTTQPLLRNIRSLANDVKRKNLTSMPAQLQLTALAKKIQEWMNVQNTDNLKGRALDRYNKMKVVFDKIQEYIKSSSSIRNTVWQISGDAEREAKPELFSEVFIRNHPNCVKYNEKGHPVLKDVRYVELYEAEEARWTKLRNQRRPKISGDEQRFTSTERAIAKIVSNECSMYQEPLINLELKDSWSERGVLLENTKIVSKLSKFKPETVTAKRYATVFPGGEADPSQLDTTKSYVSKGYTFIGGERSSNNGFCMNISLKKGYPIDARGYYGHQTDDSDSKMQWVALPGSVFNFKKVEIEAGESVYYFDQIDRNIE